MTDDAALFAAALARPTDDTPRLVLADWYDDHGEDELAWALRTHDTIIPFLAELARWDRMPATPTRELRGGHVVNRFESQYWAELLVRYRDQFPEPPEVPREYNPDAGWTAADPSERAGPGCFLQAWQTARGRQIAGLREAAADAAAGWRSRPISLPAGEDLRATEERAALLHELVLRGCGPGVIHGGAQAWADLAAAGHPLFRLPGHLLDLETEIEQTVNGSFAAWPPPRPLPTRPGPGLAATITASHPSPPDGPAFAAVRRWAAESNGRFEASVFALAVPFTQADEWDGWFRALPLDPLRANSPTASVGRTTAPMSFRSLFHADRYGGAYSPQAGLAYPRLHAWESLGWLVGADVNAACADIARIAGQSRWYTFDSDWFDHIAWDLGLICVRPDGMSVAVLAATDAD
jgi:uncharacterized protein (TIGR02996 family)